MSPPRLDATSVLLASAVATVAAGIAIHLHVGPSLGTLPALVLVGLGLTTVTSRVAQWPVDRLRRDAVRWWALAVVGFVPYGLLVAPGTDAAATGAPAVDPIAGTALEAVAGAIVCCAVAVTVLYGFARYGLYPGRPTPEERVLND